MKHLQKLTYKTLYQLWGGLFVLTAVLGLLFPSVEEGAGRFFLALIAAVFFLPPWRILTKAKAEGNRHHLRLVRYLALASLGLTTVLLCAGILSVGRGEALGNLLHVLLTIICAPLVCSNYYALSLFGWAMLLYGSFGKKK